MNIYCTLADRHYLAKLLCLIQSMRVHVPHAELHVLAMDDYVNDVLSGLAMTELDLRVMPLWALEDDDARLREVKTKRTVQEYAWTLGSYWMARVMDDAWMQTHGSYWLTPRIVYLDADSYFFGDPQVVFDEIGDASVALVPHRIIPTHRDAFSHNGVFNANFVHARRDPLGLAFAHEWRDLCLDWCFYRTDDLGRFADQGYLDQLALKYRAHVIQNLGLNLAPWNQLQYEYHFDEVLTIRDPNPAGGWEWPLIMFHFHEFQSPDSLTGWELHPMVRQHIYQPYLAAMDEVYSRGLVLRPEVQP